MQGYFPLIPSLSTSLFLKPQVVYFMMRTHHSIALFKGGVAGLFFIASIGRAQFHRVCSASKKDGLVALFPTPPSSLVLSLGMGAD